MTDTNLTHLYIALSETFATMLATAATPAAIRDAIYNFLSDIQGSVPYSKLRQIEAGGICATLPRYLQEVSNDDEVSQVGSEYLSEDMEE